MIGGSVPKHDVQVDRCDERGMGIATSTMDAHVVSMRRAPFKRAAHIVIQQIAELTREEHRGVTTRQARA